MSKTKKFIVTIYKGATKEQEAAFFKALKRHFEKKKEAAPANG